MGRAAMLKPELGNVSRSCKATGTAPQRWPLWRRENRLTAAAPTALQQREPSQ